MDSWLDRNETNETPRIIPEKTRIAGPERSVVGGPTNEILDQPAVTQVKGIMIIAASCQFVFMPFNKRLPMKMADTSEKNAITVKVITTI